MLQLRRTTEKEACDISRNGEKNDWTRHGPSENVGVVRKELGWYGFLRWVPRELFSGEPVSLS
jgi:hypothetical protein